MVVLVSDAAAAFSSIWRSPPVTRKWNGRGENIPIAGSDFCDFFPLAEGNQCAHVGKEFWKVFIVRSTS